MGFVLRFFHAPQVTTVRQAIAWADGRHTAQPPVHPSYFARFVQSITEFYPNRPEGDDESDLPCLWPEGLYGDDGQDAVTNVLLHTPLLDEGVMSVIARHADAAGLQILDEQNGLLFGPGLRMIGLHDATAQPLPPITDFAYSVMRENLRGLYFDTTRRALAAACQQALGPEFSVSEGRHTTVVQREHGALQQILSLRVMRSTDGQSARIYCRLGFACEALTQVWLPLLPAAFAQRLAKYNASAGGTDVQFAGFVPDLAHSALPAQWSLATASHMRLTDAAQLEALLDALTPWAQGTLRPFLEQVRSVDDLQPLCLHEASLQHARSGPMAFPMYPAMLALAQRSGPQALEDYVQAYRANADFPYLCRLFKDPSGSHWDSLVQGLRR